MDWKNGRKFQDILRDVLKMHWKTDTRSSLISKKSNQKINTKINYNWLINIYRNAILSSSLQRNNKIIWFMKKSQKKIKLKNKANLITTTINTEVIVKSIEKTCRKSRIITATCFQTLDKHNKNCLLSFQTTPIPILLYSVLSHLLTTVNPLHANRWSRNNKTFNKSFNRIIQVSIHTNNNKTSLFLTKIMIIITHTLTNISKV